MSYKYFAIGIICLLVSIVSCRRDDYYEGNDVELAFSVDTLRIDTVFTTLGSATRWFKVYNKKDQPILVDIKLRQEKNAFFRINADGVKGPLVENLEIAGGDSIYIFVEVTVDPDQPLSLSPFILEDQIDIDANGKIFTAHLEAWGQNANYITPPEGKG
ncbi:MAG: hypothetical protein WAT26_12970, partial [Saprospiraceae bacterium]